MNKWVRNAVQAAMTARSAVAMKVVMQVMYVDHEALSDAIREEELGLRVAEIASAWSLVRSSVTQFLFPLAIGGDAGSAR